MSRMCVAMVVALAFAVSPALAQDKQAEKQADKAKAIESEIAKLRAAQAELEAQIKKLTIESNLKLAKERKDAGVKDKIIEIEKEHFLNLKDDLIKEAQKRAQIELEMALKLKDDQLKRVEVEIEKALKLADDQVKRVQIEGGKTLVLKGAQDKPRVEFVPGGRDNVPYEKMTPEQLKELITKLQRVLEDKVRNAEREKNVEKVKPVERIKPGSPDRPERLERKPGAASQDEIMKRLDMLQKEIEELKRAIKK